MKLATILKLLARHAGIDPGWRGLVGFDWRRDAKRLLAGTDEPTILDVGANRGQTAVELVRTWPRARLHSFEPDPETHRALAEAVAPLERVTTHDLALGAADAEATLHRMKGRDGSSLHAPDARRFDHARGAWVEADGTTGVRVARLDTFCRAHAIERIDLLKIDTQGHEADVLAGAGDLLAPETIRLVVLELLFVPLYEHQSSYADVCGTLADRGYQLVDLYDKSRFEDRHLRWCDALFVGGPRPA